MALLLKTDVYDIEHRKGKDGHIIIRVKKDAKLRYILKQIRSSSKVDFSLMTVLHLKTTYQFYKLRVLSRSLVSLFHWALNLEQLKLPYDRAANADIYLQLLMALKSHGKTLKKLNLDNLNFCDRVQLTLCSNLLRYVTVIEGEIATWMLERFAAQILYRAAEKYDNWFFVGAGLYRYSSTQKEYFKCHATEKVNTLYFLFKHRIEL